MILDFMAGKVAVMLVDELPADRKLRVLSWRSLPPHFNRRSPDF